MNGIRKIILGCKKLDWDSLFCFVCSSNNLKHFLILHMSFYESWPSWFPSWFCVTMFDCFFFLLEQLTLAPLLHSPLCILLKFVVLFLLDVYFFWIKQKGAIGMMRNFGTFYKAKSVFLGLTIQWIHSFHSKKNLLT